jgi:hypothetical protein
MPRRITSIQTISNRVTAAAELRTVAFTLETRAPRKSISVLGLLRIQFSHNTNESLIGYLQAKLVTAPNPPHKTDQLPDGTKSP